MRETQKDRYVIFSSVGDGSTLTNSGEQMLSHQIITIPAGFIQAGKVLKATLMGKASNASTTPGTLLLRVRWNTTTGINGTAMAASAALTQLAASTQTDKTWVWIQYFNCIADGTSGAMRCIGTIIRGNREAAAVTDITPDLIPASAAADVTINTTIPVGLSFTASPSLTTASITCQFMVLEALN